MQVGFTFCLVRDSFHAMIPQTIYHVFISKQVGVVIKYLLPHLHKYNPYLRNELNITCIRAHVNMHLASANNNS